jgi:homoserine O-acetyltransferase
VARTETSERGSVGVVATQTADLTGALDLEVGGRLENVRIAYETYGELTPARDNVLLVCHALSGDAHAAGWSAEVDTPTALDGFGATDRGVSSRGGLGWWDGMIGPGKSFDTDRWFVICANLLGGCRGSTGPASLDPATGAQYGPDFPVVTVADQVEVQRRLLEQLGIDSVLGVTGGSLGGMIALEWAVRHPDRVRACLPIASTAALDARGLAWNAIARNAITTDPDWQGGRYYDTGRLPRRGLGIARQVGHVTYLSAESMTEKFGRRLQERDDYSFTTTGADFAVESYLRHQAETFADRFDANTYLLLSRSLTYFDLARAHGGGDLASALAPARASFLLISFSSDWLYPPRDSERLHDALVAAGKNVEHHRLETAYGHDSFLLETEQQRPHVRAFLDRVYQEAR